MNGADIFMSRRLAISGYTYLVLAWLLVLCIVVQTFIAGLGMFTNPVHFRQHVSFVHFFEFIPVLMLIAAFAGKLDSLLKWHAAGLFVFIYSQYFTANLPIAGAAHPVIALLLFGYAISVAKLVGACIKGKGGVEK